MALVSPEFTNSSPSSDAIFWSPKAYDFSRLVNWVIRSKSYAFGDQNLTSSNGKQLVNSGFANTVTVIAHRGNSSEAPENTLAAFSQAVELGVDYLEFDIQLTKDKVPVVIHDPILKRTTDNQDPLFIHEVTEADLQQLDAGGWFDQSFAGQTIPTLEQVLQMPLGHTGLMIEIKGEFSGEYEIAYAVSQTLQKNPISSPVLIGSLNPAVLTFIRLLLPDMPIIAIVDDPSHLLCHDSNSPDLYAFDKTALAVDLIEKIHKTGRMVWAWTVDEESEIELLKEWGVDGIITNRPRTAMGINHSALLMEKMQ